MSRVTVHLCAFGVIAVVAACQRPPATDEPNVSDHPDRFVSVTDNEEYEQAVRNEVSESEQTLRAPEAPVLRVEATSSGDLTSLYGAAGAQAGMAGGGSGPGGGPVLNPGGRLSSSGRAAVAYGAGSVGYGSSIGRRGASFSRATLALGNPTIIDESHDGDRFEAYGENSWVETADDALATFSIDVDSASYSLVRDDLNAARRPRADAVRVEEFVNVFDYGYAPPEGIDVPFAVHLEAAPSRFGEGLELLRVGIQGYETHPGDRAPANLVFLVDTSGSMMGPDRLGLVQYSLEVILDALGPSDTLSIVSYAGRAETVLAPTPVGNRPAIRQAIRRLQAGGTTNGADGIRTAYELAGAAFVAGGTNRVIWCSDGDLNVGMTGDTLLAYIEENRSRGVALTTLGFGRGNYNDRDMERFADHGDGNYHYIDDRNEALRVLGDELTGTLQVIARDVKIQVEFDDELVESYRLIGYENRDIADADFRNDAVDAGEIGSGHSVTALLELRMRPGTRIWRAERVATVRVRYEMPDQEGDGREIAEELWSDAMQGSFDDASASFRLAAAVAELAEVLRGSTNVAVADFDAIEAVVRGAQVTGDLQVEELAALVTQARSVWQ